VSTFQYASIWQCDGCGKKAPGVPDLNTASSTPPGWVARRYNAVSAVFRLIDGAEKTDFCEKCSALTVVQLLELLAGRTG
jgi:hypothetical protein